MKTYESKQELMDAIRNSFNEYISEFDDILDSEENEIIIGIEKTPAQNISYQLGWLSLLLEWEKKEKEGKHVITPKEGYKWNNLGALYQNFYEIYTSYSLSEKIALLSEKVNEVLDWIEALSNDELFQLDQRKWATTAAKWPLYKWIHINTVAPFTNFRKQIRKWKKFKNS